MCKSVTLVLGTLPLAPVAPQSPRCIAEAPAVQPPPQNYPLPLQCFWLVLCSGRPRLLPQGDAFLVARGSPCCKGDTARGSGLGLLPPDVSAQRHFGIPLLLCFTSQQGPMLDATGRCSHQQIVPSFCTNSTTLKAPSPASPKGFLIHDSSDTHSMAKLSPGGFGFFCQLPSRQLCLSPTT